MSAWIQVHHFGIQLVLPGLLGVDKRDLLTGVCLRTWDPVFVLVFVWRRAGSTERAGLVLPKNAIWVFLPSPVVLWRVVSLITGCFRNQASILISISTLLVLVQALFWTDFIVTLLAFTCDARWVLLAVRSFRWPWSSYAAVRIIPDGWNRPWTLTFLWLVAIVFAIWVHTSVDLVCWLTAVTSESLPTPVFYGWSRHQISYLLSIVRFHLSVLSIYRLSYLFDCSGVSFLEASHDSAVVLTLSEFGFKLFELEGIGFIELHVVYSCFQLTQRL
jgi:hypothetical protein